MMPGGSIHFRHYTVSLHAIDRFVERCNRPAGEILPLLHKAYVAYEHRARRSGIRRVIRVAEQRGGYVLSCQQCYFIVVPDTKTDRHVVTTVLSPPSMTNRGR